MAFLCFLSMLKKIILGISITVFVFSFAYFVFAQEESATSTEDTTITQEATQEIQEEENVTAQDLEIKEPSLLPDSPFYFLKNWWRGLRLGLTFDPVKKAELRERFANEKLIELKKLIEKKKSLKAIERARKNYEKEVEALQKASERLRNVKDKTKVESFMDKFIRHQMLHQKLLEKLENQVPPQAFEKIKEAREKHLERFKEVMLKLEDKNKLPERLEKAVENMKGSEFKEIKALEILKRVEEKVQSQEAKQAIQQARERILNRTREKLEQLPEKKREILKKFIENLPGDKESQLEILEDLKEKLNNTDLEENLQTTRERLMQRVIERKKERLQQMSCPEIAPPEKDFCKTGRIIIQKDESGCPQFVCIPKPKMQKITPLP